MKKLLWSLAIVVLWSSRAYGQSVWHLPGCSPSRHAIIMTPQQREAIVVQRLYQMISRTDDSMVSRYQTSTDPYIRQAANLVAKDRLILKELTIRSKKDD